MHFVLAGQLGVLLAENRQVPLDAELRERAGAQADLGGALGVALGVVGHIGSQQLFSHPITSANIGDFEGSEDPSIRTFLGEDEEGGTFDPGLGLPADFAVQVITQVGNYGEIFDEHLAPLGLERGQNALWTDGGLLYAPPYR